MSNKYYYQALKREDYASDDEFLLARVKKGLEASFTFEQCQEHWFQDLADALGCSEAGPVYKEQTKYVRPVRQQNCALAAMKQAEESN